MHAQAPFILCTWNAPITGTAAQQYTARAIQQNISAQHMNFVPARQNHESAIQTLNHKIEMRAPHADSHMFSGCEFFRNHEIAFGATSYGYLAAGTRDEHRCATICQQQTALVARKRLVRTQIKSVNIESSECHTTW